MTKTEFIQMIDRLDAAARADVDYACHEEWMAAYAAVIGAVESMKLAR